MVSLTKREVNGHEYYYLSYSYREGDKTKLKEKYLGVNAPDPDDLENRKKTFMLEIAEELWIPVIEGMRQKYAAKLKALPETVKAKDLRGYGIKFTHHTNKIEGSSLTKRDVKLIIEDGIVPPNKPSDDVIEAKSHMAVYEDMIKCKEEITLDLLLKWHDKLFSLTKPEIAGKVREYQVVITGSNHTPPPGGIAVRMLLDDLLKWYHKNKNTLHPVSVACMMHYDFVSIHPFGDGNGRVTRLLTNYILFRKGYPMFDIDPKIRYGYYRALEDANVKGDPAIFIRWFFKAYIRANQEYA